MSDEYEPQALAAIEQLRSHAAVDPARIFLVGHSLGGTVAPRIAAAEPSVAGVVLLAGGAEPLHQAMVRQVRYLASLSPESEAASAPAIEALSEKARLVDSPELSQSTPADQLPFGAPAAYWLDVRAYDPVALAATLGKPLLILQGGRDYQVTVADDLARWEAGLSGRDQMTIRVYPALNHLFAPGNGPSSPGGIRAGPACRRERDRRHRELVDDRLGSTARSVLPANPAARRRAMGRFRSCSAANSFVLRYQPA